MGHENRLFLTSPDGPVVSSLYGVMGHESATATSDVERRLMNRRLSHIQGVVSITNTLIDNMGGVIEDSKHEGERWNRSMAQTIAWWHDSARFREINQHAKVNTGKYIHAFEGAALFKDMFMAPNSPNWEQFAQKAADSGIDYQIVMDAIHDHGLREYTGNCPYTKVIRDADKIEICNDIEAIITTFIDSEGLTEDRWYSVEAIKEFENTDVISNGNVHTVPDGLLRVSTWYDDLNFEASRNMWNTYNIPEQIRVALSSRGLSLPSNPRLQSIC
jgi:hypothetical protein